MNRRLLGPAAVATLVILLSGCTSSPEAGFLSDLRAATPDVLKRVSQEQAVKLAHLMCESMDRGDSAFENAAMLEELGWSIAESGTFVIAAVENFCPEHEALVR